MIPGIVAHTIAAAFEPPVGTVSDRWRLYFHHSTSDSNVVLHEVEMRAKPTGQNLCVGGTIMANNENLPAANAFDGNPSSAWRASGVPSWLEYQFPAPVSVNTLLLRSGGNSNDIPRWFELQHWDGSSWITTQSFFTNEWTTDATILLGGPVTVGAELVADTSFDDPAYWTTSGGWSVSGGNLIASGAGDRLSKPGLLVAGRRYRTSFPYNKTAGQRLRTGSSSGVLYKTNLLATTGMITAEFTAGGAEFRLEAEGSTFSGSIPNISVKQIDAVPLSPGAAGARIIQCVGSVDNINALSLPNPVTPGNFLVCMFVTQAIPTPASGWAEINSDILSGHRVNSAIYVRKAVAGDGAKFSPVGTGVSFGASFLIEVASNFETIAEAIGYSHIQKDDNTEPVEDIVLPAGNFLAITAGLCRTGSAVVTTDADYSYLGDSRGDNRRAALQAKDGVTGGGVVPRGFALSGYSNFSIQGVYFKKA